MKTKALVLLILAGALIAVWASRGWACLPRYAKLEDVVDEAKTIFVGRLKEIECSYASGQPLTRLVIEVRRVLRGVVPVRELHAYFNPVGMERLTEDACQAEWQDRSGTEKNMEPGKPYIFMFREHLGGIDPADETELQRAEELNELMALNFLLQPIKIAALSVQDSGLYEKKEGLTPELGEHYMTRTFRLLNDKSPAAAAADDVFGFHFLIEGEPVGRKIKTAVSVRHPAVQDSASGEVRTASSWTQHAIIGSARNFVGWQFDTENGVGEGEYDFLVCSQSSNCIKQKISVMHKSPE